MEAVMPSPSAVRCASVLALLAFSCSSVRAQTWTIIDLDPGNTFDETYAYGINGPGHLTGTGYIAATGDLHALIFAGSAIHDLGMLGGQYGAAGIAINDSDTVAAIRYGPGWRAVRYANNQVTAIGSIEGHNDEPLAMNNLGHIVGRAMDDENNSVGFSYIGGQFTPMTTAFRATGINDSDQIVGPMGYYWSYGGFVHSVNHAFLYSNNTYTDLGSVGGGARTDTAATAINAAGQVVGWSTAADGTVHAFVYSNSQMNDLGTIAPYYAYPVAINAGGMVAGNLTTYVGGPVGAFVCVNSVMSTFDSRLDGSGSAWSGLTITGLNDAGWIAGYGTINSMTHAFLAIPSQAAQAIPFGAGCGTPPLTIASAGGTLPVIGSTLWTDVAHGDPSFTVMAVGLSAANLGPIPLPLALGPYGMPGCNLYQDLAGGPSNYCAPTVPGTMRYTLPIPLFPGLVGLHVYLQAWSAATGQNAAGLITSNGLDLTVGSQ
jgi:probable HAF family extracellular repeat protein